MPVAEDEAVDGVLFAVLLGKAHQMFVLLAQVFGIVVAGLAAVGRPSQGECHAPPRVYGCIEALAETAAKNLPQQAEREVAFSHIVAVREKEAFPADVGNKCSVVYGNTQFVREVVENPNVVIPDKPMYIYPAVAQFGQFTEESGKPPGYHVAIFIPIVQNIPQQIQRTGIVLDTVEPSHNAPFIFQRIFDLPVNGITDYSTWYEISGIYTAVSRIAQP